MGTGSYGQLCYCKSYNEQGEIYYNDLFNLSSNDNNNSRYINNYQININNNININNEERTENNNNNIFQFSIEESELAYNSNLSNLDNESNVKRSLSFNSIALESIDKLCPEKRTCTICLENFQKLDKVINLNCLHMFHDNCIKTWLKNNNYCPICKNEIN